MKFKKFFHSSCATLAAVALLAASLSSCGNKSSELADLIPADSKVVCKINLAQVIENTGSTISQDGKIKLSDDLNNAISQPAIRAIVNQALGYAEGINLEDAYFFVRTAADNGYLVASLTNAETVGENLNKIFGSPKQENGYDVYSMGGEPLIAVKDNILWVADSLDGIEETIEAAKTNPLGPGIKEYLAQDNALGIAVDPQNIKGFNLPSQYNDQWICGSIKFQNQTVSGEACMMDIDGKREPFGNALGEIDTDFLRYVPENSQIVMAIGNIEAPGLKNMLGSLGTMAGNYGFLLTDLDGTVGAALDCDALLSNLNAFTNMSENQMMEFFMTKCKFILMAHYPQATLDNIDKLITSSGMPAKKDANGIYSFSMNDLSVNFGEADGNFAIANYPIKADSQNQFNTHFLGRRAAIYAVSKPENNLMGSAKFGSECELWLESDALKGQCTLTDTNQKFLEAFVSVLISPEFKDIINMIIEESMPGNNSQTEFYYEPDFSEYE